MNFNEIKDKKDLVTYIKKNYTFLKKIIEDTEEMIIATSRTGSVVYVKRTQNLVFFNDFKVSGIINSVSEKKIKTLIAGV